MSRNCLQCEHYFVTWDVQAPRGCKVFGFKSQRFPSQIVKEQTGLDCPYFKQGKRKQKDSNISNKDK